MGTFLNHPVTRLVPGRSDPYEHWFGGAPTHRGSVPPGGKHAVNLLYDLDLRDPQLGLAARFPHLSRLPLYNALQYNCCDMVYRVIAEDAIEIVWMSQPGNNQWNANFPYEKYPTAFPRTQVVAEPVGAEMLALLEEALVDDGANYTSSAFGPIRRKLEALGYPFSQIGGQHFMWQGIPDWDCKSRGCKFAKKASNKGKEVFAVVWERPIPSLHLWSDDPAEQDVGSCQIIFSRCTGCGVLHSCNRCD